MVNGNDGLTRSVGLNMWEMTHIFGNWLNV